MTDAALLARVSAGDRCAFDEFYDRFARPAYSMVRRICATRHTADDAFQDVFLQVWRRAGRFDPARGSPATWLLTLAHHTAVDAVRREASVRGRTQPISDDEWELPISPGADHAAIVANLAEQVRGVLAGLAPTQRRVLALAYYGGHTQSEIAAILDIPVGTVKSRTFTALALLRERLQPWVA